jgi:hypothetical protein
MKPEVTRAFVHLFHDAPQRTEKTVEQITKENPDSEHGLGFVAEEIGSSADRM